MAVENVSAVMNKCVGVAVVGYFCWFVDVGLHLNLVMVGNDAMVMMMLMRIVVKVRMSPSSVVRCLSSVDHRPSTKSSVVCHPSPLFHRPLVVSSVVT